MDYSIYSNNGNDNDDNDSDNDNDNDDNNNNNNTRAWATRFPVVLSYLLSHLKTKHALICHPIMVTLVDLMDNINQFQQDCFSNEIPIQSFCACVFMCQ